jgi:hypothetical protein
LPVTVPLTSDEEARIAAALRGRDEEVLATPMNSRCGICSAARRRLTPAAQVVVSGFNLEVRRMDLVRLTGSHWLNDEVLASLSPLHPRSPCFCLFVHKYFLLEVRIVIPFRSSTSTWSFSRLARLS